MVDHLFSLGFSSGEIMVLDSCISDGDISNQQIADKLFVCKKTVQFHLTNIYKIFQINGDKGEYKRVKLLVKLIDILKEKGFKLKS